MNVLLLSTYELGHQPLGLASPAAHLSVGGQKVVCRDLAVDPLDEAAVREAEFVGISVPMHTATRLGVRLAERVRALNRGAHICFYGLYASPNAEALLGRFADSAVGGEFEGPLVNLVSNLAGGRSGYSEGVTTTNGGAPAFLGRQSFLVPRRDLLPGLERYARAETGTRQKLAGYVEASRGCAHHCLHCPITPVYGGRLRVVQEEVVLADIRQLVAMGAEHITFGDPDFFNGIRHSLHILEAMHGEFPELTFDATIKIEHILEHRQLMPALKELGCLFIVSAVEAIDDGILANLDKGHTAADVDEALEIAAADDIPLRPTFVAFTPWISLGGYLRLLEFVEERELIGHIDPVQFAIRLLVPRGSSLIGTAAMEPFLGPFDEATFTHTWQHPDRRVERLCREVGALVEEAAHAAEEPIVTFAKIKGLALSALNGGRATPAEVAWVPNTPVPRLTEPWFC